MDMSNPVYLLIWLLVASLVAYGIYILLIQLAIPPVARTIILLLFLIVMLVWLLNGVGML